MQNFDIYDKLNLKQFEDNSEYQELVEKFKSKMYKSFSSKSTVDIKSFLKTYENLMVQHISNKSFKLDLSSVNKNILTLFVLIKLYNQKVLESPILQLLLKGNFESVFEMINSLEVTVQMNQIRPAPKEEVKEASSEITKFKFTLPSDFTISDKFWFIVLKVLKSFMVQLRIKKSDFRKLRSLFNYMMKLTTNYMNKNSSLINQSFTSDTILTDESTKDGTDDTQTSDIGDFTTAKFIQENKREKQYISTSWIQVLVKTGVFTDFSCEPIQMDYSRFKEVDENITNEIIDESKVYEILGIDHTAADST